MGALLCTRCGREIVPGTLVEFIGVADDETPLGNFILTTDDLLVVHATCPEVDDG